MLGIFFMHHTIAQWQNAQSASKRGFIQVLPIILFAAFAAATFFLTAQVQNTTSSLDSRSRASCVDEKYPAIYQSCLDGASAQKDPAAWIAGCPDGARRLATEQCGSATTNPPATDTTNTCETGGVTASACYGNKVGDPCTGAPASVCEKTGVANNYATCRCRFTLCSPGECYNSGTAWKKCAANGGYYESQNYTSFESCKNITPPTATPAPSTAPVDTKTDNKPCAYNSYDANYLCPMDCGSNNYKQAVDNLFYCNGEGPAEIRQITPTATPRPTNTPTIALEKKFILRQSTSGQYGCVLDDNGIFTFRECNDRATSRNNIPTSTPISTVKFKLQLSDRAWYCVGTSDGTLSQTDCNTEANARNDQRNPNPTNTPTPKITQCDDGFTCKFSSSCSSPNKAVGFCNIGPRATGNCCVLTNPTATPTPLVNKKTDWKPCILSYVGSTTGCDAECGSDNYYQATTNLWYCNGEGPGKAAPTALSKPIPYKSPVPKAKSEPVKPVGVYNSCSEAGLTAIIERCTSDPHVIECIMPFNGKASYITCPENKTCNILTALCEPAKPTTETIKPPAVDKSHDGNPCVVQIPRGAGSTCQTECGGTNNYYMAPNSLYYCKGEGPEPTAVPTPRSGRKLGQGCNLILDKFTPQCAEGLHCEYNFYTGITCQPNESKPTTSTPTTNTIAKKVTLKIDDVCYAEQVTGQGKLNDRWCGNCPGGSDAFYLDENDVRHCGKAPDALVTAKTSKQTDNASCGSNVRNLTNCSTECGSLGYYKDPSNNHWYCNGEGPKEYYPTATPNTYKQPVTTNSNTTPLKPYDLCYENRDNKNVLNICDQCPYPNNILNTASLNMKKCGPAPETTSSQLPPLAAVGTFNTCKEAGLNPTFTWCTNDPNIVQCGTKVFGFGNPDYIFCPANKTCSGGECKLSTNATPFLEDHAKCGDSDTPSCTMCKSGPGEKYQLSDGLHCGNYDNYLKDNSGKFITQFTSCPINATCRCDSANNRIIQSTSSVGTSTYQCYADQMCSQNGSSASCIKNPNFSPTNVKGVSTQSVAPAIPLPVTSAYCSPVPNSSELLGVDVSGKVIGVVDCKKAYGPDVTCQKNSCTLNATHISFDPTIFK